ncbi:hypothetical protein CBS12448_2233 [Aspergillus niger]|nr:hypothetical protein CBS12448_2233 [Aspergillus niger]KAI3016257.1 hypothetical protein CBS147345_4716 [Aspergillus niger]KAI3050676.1 hypothetical protein CBS147352_5340 [Aspergillus niger]
MVNRIIFWWLNPLLARGSRGLLSPSYLFPIDPNLSAEVAQGKFESKWSLTMNYRRGGQYDLLLAILSCVRRTLIWTAIPRIGLIGLKISQPLFLNCVIRYLSVSTKDNAVGGALVGATVLIYLGTAATTSLYMHGLNRAITVIRSLLITALYEKTQRLDTVTVNNSAALTLMSTDTETICNSLMRLDALFASPIEVSLAIFFLARQPPGHPHAREYGTRLSKSALQPLQRRICDLRNFELERARGARMLIMWRNVVANIPQIAGPILTFTISTMVSGSGVVTSANSFTVLALIALVTQPIQVFVHGITQVGAALGCFKRIQDYLLLPEIETGRISYHSDDHQTSESRQDLPRRLGDFSVYRYYLKSMGWKSSACFLCLIVVQVFGSKFPTIWLQYWSDHDFNYSLSVYLGVYGACAFIQLIGTILSITFLIVFLVAKSSRRLHTQLLTATMNAPYSFFTTHDSGTILNRFSQDLSQIDNQLSGALLMTIFGAGTLIAEVMLIAAGNKYIAITVPFVITVFYALQNFYLRTSRQLRLMELEAQSPLYTHFLETASGTDTIRAFGWQAAWAARCRQLVDRAIQPYYTMFCIQRWLNLVLELLAAGLAIIVVSVAVTLGSSVHTGAIAVSLLNILGFSSSLSYLITSWTQLETTLGAIARVKSYEETVPKEDAPNSGLIQQPTDDWPSRGSIRFDHVYASYDAQQSPHQCILRDIALNIHPGEKLAICGRSGSGKSSLILLLFKLLDPIAGSVFIDGINLRDVPCDVLRARLTVIPQDPLIFPGTLRFNLDPSGEQFSDETMCSALATVGLGMDRSTRQPYSLDLQISEGTFSRGQCQLLSLARALLRQTETKVLVLDEISGSVDIATERLMFQIIGNYFEHATVIAVTHRLRCIREFDQVVIMQDGCVVETGRPGELLGGRSLFRQLWDEQ